jgi:hypothetical protein
VKGCFHNSVASIVLLLGDLTGLGEAVAVSSSTMPEVPSFETKENPLFF